jgi:hypothetical protein
MLAYIPLKLKRWLILTTIPCVAVIAAYFLLPVVGFPDYVSGKNWRLTVSLAGTIPVLVFRAFHLPVSSDQKVNKRIDTVFLFGLFCWLIAFVCFAWHEFLFGFIALAVAATLVLYAHVKWLASFPTPRQVLIAEGERVLANEPDPIERQKFRWSLDRFKKP